MATHGPRRKIGRGSRWTLLLWGAAAMLLALPFVAMRFTTEVNWSASDFIIMGILLTLVCAGIELAVRLTDNVAYRLACAAAIGGAFLITWANLAVGHEHGPNHLLLYGALLIGVAASAIVRFSAKGMAVVMVLTACALVVALRLAMLNDADPEGPNLLITAVASVAIASPFLIAAWLFRRAART